MTVAISVAEGDESRLGAAGGEFRSIELAGRALLTQLWVHLTLVVVLGVFWCPLRMPNRESVVSFGGLSGRWTRSETACRENTKALRASESSPCTVPRPQQTLPATVTIPTWDHASRQW